MYTKKYAPKSINDLFIHREDILRLKRMILERKPVILNGPTGCGKTSLAYVLAGELGYELFEVNASDERSQKNLEASLIPSSKEGSLFAKGRLILIDDIEALSGTKDRGGLPTVVQIVEESHWPIIITASDIHDFKFSKLKSRCGLIEISKVDDSSVLNMLRVICEKEGILYNPLVLKELAEKSEGDLRAAINDLQTLSANKQLDSLDGFDKREKESDILAALSTVFKAKDVNKVINSFNDANVDLDEALLWIDENLPGEYTDPNDLAKAYLSLSKSDVFSGRIRRWQYWRFLVYRNFFLTAGVSLAKNKEYLSFNSYKRSGRLLKLFWAKQKNMKKHAIAAKIAEKTHCSKKRVLKDVLPYLQIVYKKGFEIEDLDLGKEEIEWLRTK